MNKTKQIGSMINKCIDRTSARKCPKWIYKLNIGKNEIKLVVNNN